MALVVACTSPAASPSASPVRAASSGASAPISPSAKIVLPTASPATASQHVFVIVMENSSLATALRAPSISALASKYTLATNYRAVSSPSLPNYLALTSGSTWGITDDAYHVLPAGGLGAQLTAAGVTWRAYMEGLTSAGCLGSPYPYALKHNPFAYYGGSCPANVVPLDALDGGPARDTPSFVWITPGLCHDGHDCAPAEAGAGVRGLLPRNLGSSPLRDHRAPLPGGGEGDGPA